MMMNEHEHDEHELDEHEHDDESLELQSLLDEAARKETVDTIDPEPFLVRLNQRLQRRQRLQKLFTAAAAAVVLFAIIFPYTMPDPGSTPPTLDHVLVQNPSSQLLEQLYVLELLEGMDPELIAILAPTHIDTLDGFDLYGFDLDLAALPLELLVDEQEEE
ncbi:MAG: hypothetical protein OSB09_01010 [Planctomycetota bacterium]|nr:hypothetical protein [Planctomycetota bacterium]